MEMLEHGGELHVQQTYSREGGRGRENMQREKEIENAENEKEREIERGIRDRELEKGYETESEGE